MLVVSKKVIEFLATKKAVSMSKHRHKMWRKLNSKAAGENGLSDLSVISINKYAKLTVLLSDLCEYNLIYISLSHSAYPLT